jgi:hypothetical protein
MKSITIALACILLFAAGATAAACGGNDSETPTLEEYFQRLVAVYESFEEQGEALSDAFDERLEFAESEEAELEAYGSFLHDGVEFFRDFLDEIGRLSPAAVAESAHEQFLEAGELMLDAFEESVDQATDAESVDDIATQLREETYVAAAERFSEACLALEALAEENRIDADLGCEEE